MGRRTGVVNAESMIERVKQEAPKAALFDILRDHIAAAYAASPTNARYVTQAEERMGRLWETLQDGQGEVLGMVNGWFTSVRPVIDELFGVSLTDDERDSLAAQFGDYSDTFVPNLESRVRQLGVDEIMGPLFALDFRVGEPKLI